MKRSIVLKTRIYAGTISAYDNLADLIIDVTGNTIDAFDHLRDLENSYPNFYKWYHEIVLPDIRKGKNGRRMYFAVSDVFEKNYISKQLTGLVILKRTPEEKKICTIRVFSRYQGQGIGQSLLEKSFEYLKTNKPLITISDKNREYFSGLIEKYQWSLKQILPNYYQPDAIEYVYNGKLVNDDEYLKLLDEGLRKFIKRDTYDCEIGRFKNKEYERGGNG